jgi:PAS domain S-box-containing protein
MIGRFKTKDIDSTETLLVKEVVELKKKIGEFEKREVEKQKIEETLLESEERLKILFEYAPDAYYLNDTKGRFVDANRAAEALIGYRKEELIGRSFLTEKILAKGQVQKAAALLAKNALGKETGPDELVLVRKDGTSVIVEIRTFPVKIKKIRYVLGIARDITERKRSEEALKESERQYRALFEQANDAIFHIDLNGFHVMANRRATEMLGYNLEELKKKSINDIVTPSEWTQSQHKFNGVLSGVIYSPYERIFRKKDGTEFPVEINVAPICDLKGNPLFIQSIVRDITERKKVEDALRKSREELRKLNAFLYSAQEEERALFAHEMHDEIGQGLTALKMDLTRLRKNLSSEEGENFSLLSSIEELATEMIYAVRRMYTEMRPSMLDELGLLASLEWQLEEFQKRTGISCIFRSEAADITLEKDQLTAVFRIAQELLNRIAWDGKATQVKMKVRKFGNDCQLRIEDDGAADEQDDAFSSALIGIKERVEYLGGVFHLEGEKGKNTVASLSIPLQKVNRKSVQTHSS